MSHTRAAQARQELPTLKHIWTSSSVSIQEATVITQIQNHRMTQAGRVSWGLLSMHLSQVVHPDLIQLSCKISPGLKTLQPLTVSVPGFDNPHDAKGFYISTWNLPFQLVSFALAPSSCTSRKFWQHLFYTLPTPKVAEGIEVLKLLYNFPPWQMEEKHFPLCLSSNLIVPLITHWIHSNTYQCCFYTGEPQTGHNMPCSYLAVIAELTCVKGGL